MSDAHNEAKELGFIDDVSSLVKVQNEATVSRTIMENSGGNVVLFSFDAGQELSEHTAAMPVFVQTVSGHLKITASGKTVDLMPGGLVYFPTRLPHAVEAVEASIMMLTMITPARSV
jgi:quercetin dioxygenase-like cupin family protein